MPKETVHGWQGKEMVDSRSFSIWDNVGLALTKAKDAFTVEELKVLSGVPSNEIVGRHIHKLVQVMYLCNFTFPFSFCVVLKVGSSFQVLGETIHITSKYLSQEAIASSESQVKGMEVKLSKLKKDLILAMDEANTAKEKAKVLSDDLKAEKQLTLEKDEQLQAAREWVKTIVVKSIKAFQQTDKYNTVLFSWYYKGFEFLRWYLIKHLVDVA